MGLSGTASWLHQPPSAEWQWIGLVLAIISFGVALMALPTIFQMLWGKPKVKIIFSENETEPNALACSLCQPFVSKWLGAIGVRRPDARITVTWNIISGETHKVIAVMPLAEIMNYDLQKARHPVLSSSLVPMLHFLIVKRDGSKVIALDKDRTALVPGTYRADILVLLGGLQHTQAHRQFIVTTEELKWLVM